MYSATKIDNYLYKSNNKVDKCLNFNIRLLSDYCPTCPTWGKPFL